MSTYTYLTFRSTTSYDTSVSYSSRLQILSKQDVVAAGERIGVKLSMSNTKEVLAEKLSAYVLSHPKEMVAMLDDEEVVLAHDIIEAAKNAITWYPHRRKYHTLRQMVWVQVNNDKQTRKDGFVMLDEIQASFAPYVEERYEFSRKMVLASKKAKPTTPRLYLKDLPARLASLHVERLKIVHYLFQNNYMEELDDYYIDEWGIQSYDENVFDWFAAGGSEDPTFLNQLVFAILSEWKEACPSRYRKAMADIKDWMSFRFTSFDTPHAQEVKVLFDAAMQQDDERALSKFLFPFITKMREYAAEGKNLESVSLAFCLLDHLGEACKAHEAWFECYWSGGEQTRISSMLELIRHHYCYLRQLKSLSFRIKEDMDIHLLITNKYHRLFGDLECAWYDSRCADMMTDDSRYCDYTSMDDSLYDYFRGVYDKEE